MRRPIFETSNQLGRKILERAHTIELAFADATGQPVLRTLHAVIVDDLLCFHCAPVGEKTAMVGRQVVVSAHEPTVTLPSTFFDAQRACPATTYYQSVQLRGTVGAIESHERKARVLQALMEKFQPQGGHLPVDAGDPIYGTVVGALLIGCLALDQMTTKARLGQDLPANRRSQLLEQLWQRGAPGDVQAIESIRRFCATPEPAFLATGLPIKLWCALDSQRADAAAVLLDGTYWNVGISRQQIADAHRNSVAWVGATDGTEALVGSARAISDGAKHAHILDVFVAAPWRGAGLGRRLLELLLDHPRVRNCSRIWLRTRHADGFYRQLGFAPETSRGQTRTMLLDRGHGR
ncbi:MAG: GNAT family N-acetyltransferase [Deltaproteobacteria bacterium]|nr:GNAT family N-acetyltransferase [Deltaproteobacteria bacterium]